MAGKVARQYSYGWTDLTSAFDSLILEAGDQFNNPFTASEYIASDIVYDDASGVLAALLILEGHLSNGLWEGKTRRCYIEVYAVFRVFELGTESTGLRIYLDPEEQEKTEKLRYATTVTHAVVLGAGVGDKAERHRRRTLKVLVSDTLCRNNSSETRLRYSL